MAMYGHANAVQALLDVGADRYAEVRMTQYLLMTAHAIPVHRVLLHLGGSCDAEPSVAVVMLNPRCCCDADVASESLFAAVSSWCTLAVVYLVYVQDKDGLTPLLWAARNDHAACIQLLVEYIPKVM